MGKTLTFNNIILNKKEFHKFNHPIDLSLVSIDQIVVSDKFKRSDKGLSTLSAIKKVKFLNRWVLFYLK